MNNDLYTYYILKYKHSPFLDESINIGVLIYFHNSQRFSFRFSKSLVRIKSIYSNIPEKTIKEYIRQIDRTLKEYQLTEVNLFPLNDTTLKSFLSSHVLPNDSTVLQFSHFKTDSLRGFSEEFVESIIFEKLFIDDFKSNNNQPQEPKLITNFYNELRKSGFYELANKARVQKDYVVQTKTGNFNFDFAWKNGVWNLVKPVGFDLKTGDGIIQKARNNLGEFVDLESEVKSTVKCAIIVGKPSDRRLYENYTKALSILHKAPDTVKVLEEKDLKKYSEEVVEAVSKDDI